MSVTMKVRNKDRLFRRLREVAPEMEKELGPALQKSAEETASLAQQWAPRSSGSGSTPSGHYADTINAKQVDQVDAGRFGFKMGKGEKAIVQPELAWGVFAYWTWRFIEFGTSAGVKGTTATIGGRTRKVRRTHPGTPAHPHMMPAARMTKSRTKSRISRAINKAIKKASKKS